MEAITISSMNDIPNELIIGVLREKVVPFIGAGFSISFGYPNWRELILGIKNILEIDELEENDIKDVDPLQIAQALFHYYIEKKYDECEREVISDFGIKQAQSEINELLKSLVYEQTLKKLEIDFSKILLGLITDNEDLKKFDDINKLKLLDKINFNYVITTNYDKVLENEIFINQKFSVQSLGKNQELDWNEKEKTIIKIHGDKESNSGIIFTHSQYYKFMNEHGYFRSKIYTMFSSNIILMMGYGFNDINVHQIYFQFLRDYGHNIKNYKFYMILTEYDKKKWGSYFRFYEYFLKSYKIKVLLVKDLPSFIEDLYLAIEQELKSTSLESIFKCQATPEFSEVLLSVVEGENIEPKTNLSLNKDLIITFVKIFKNNFILTKEPFNLKEGDISKVGLYMLDFSSKILKKSPDIILSKECKELLNIAIYFTRSTGDFYAIKYRLEKFINLSMNFEAIELNDDFCKNLYEVFEECHPTKYLKSNPGGKLLESRLSDIPKFIIMSYLNTIKLKNYDKDDDLIYVNSVHKYWIEKIKEKFDDEEIFNFSQELTSKINS